jgi:hypothetical protein
MKAFTNYHQIGGLIKDRNAKGSPHLSSCSQGREVWIIPSNSTGCAKVRQRRRKETVPDRNERPWNKEVVKVKKDSKTLATLGRSSVLLISLLFVISGPGCAKKPDFNRLRADLEKKLEENRGNMTTGNSDIYSIISLEITNDISTDKKHHTIEYKGQVECTQGFYMSDNGKYSVKKPAWRARKHVTKGTLIKFTGTMNYELTGNSWKTRDNRTEMDIKYAPRV